MKTLLALTLFLTPPTSPAYNNIVCQQLAFGASPGQIAQALHEGTPSLTFQQALNLVWSELPECG